MTLFLAWVFCQNAWNSAASADCPNRTGCRNLRFLAEHPLKKKRFSIAFQLLMKHFLFGQCGNLNTFFSETRADQTTNMCTITQSKRNSANTTKTNDKPGVSNDLLIDFLVKFVEENVPASIHGLHGCVNKGSAEPTQFSLQVFFSSTGGMSQLSCMQKLKCAVVVSDNLC